jgi:hypothetical protein
LNKPGKSVVDSTLGVGTYREQADRGESPGCIACPRARPSRTSRSNSCTVVCIRHYRRRYRIQISVVMSPCPPQADIGCQGLPVERGNIPQQGSIVIASVMAELERCIIIERVRAGMRRARLGQQIGRSRLDSQPWERRDSLTNESAPNPFRVMGRSPNSSPQLLYL